MRRWFLSYNSQDFELAQALEAALARTDPDASIFFAPKSLRPGSYGMPALAHDIAEATAFVLLVGEKGSFFSKNDYGAEHVLLPKEHFKDVKKPERSLPRTRLELNSNRAAPLSRSQRASVKPNARRAGRVNTWFNKKRIDLSEDCPRVNFVRETSARAASSR